MDYKKTLNLPSTKFPMKANLSKREPSQLSDWEKMQLHSKVRAAANLRPTEDSVSADEAANQIIRPARFQA